MFTLNLLLLLLILSCQHRIHDEKVDVVEPFAIVAPPQPAAVQAQRQAQGQVAVAPPRQRAQPAAAAAAPDVDQPMMDIDGPVGFSETTTRLHTIFDYSLSVSFFFFFHLQNFH
jgi:hypothetical protein